MPPIPERQPETNRQQQREGFVEQANANAEADDQRHPPGRIESAFSPIQQQEEGQKQPESFAGVGQEGAAVAIGAEEA